jgi:hypothetical protein
MSGIVYQTDKRSGSTYAYRHGKVLDEGTGRVRTKREYVGRVDPSTGSIVPKAERRGNRGRTAPVTGEGCSVADLAAALRERDEELVALYREQVLTLSVRVAELVGAVAQVASVAAQALPGHPAVIGASHVMSTNGTGARPTTSGQAADVVITRAYS